MLSSCLALVKPVGMSQEDTDAWLITAAREVAYLPADILADACAATRRVATHHAQIVPGVIREGDERMAMRRTFIRMRDRNKPAPVERQIEHHKWEPTREELEALKASAVKNLKA